MAGARSIASPSSAKQRLTLDMWTTCASIGGARLRPGHTEQAPSFARYPSRSRSPMPVSTTIRTTAQEAVDSFRSELTQVFYRLLAEGNGTPYPPALVTNETDARRVVPGSLFLLKDGTFKKDTKKLVRSTFFSS